MNAVPGLLRPRPANRITCTIVAVDEVDRIERTIRSVAGLVDEVLVIDSGSRDGTVALCESLGAKVIHNSFTGFGPQKRFAEELAGCDWILNLDADEWLSDALRDELANVLRGPLPPTRCFRTRIRVVYPCRETPAPFAYFHNYVRLYNRTTTRMRDSLTHDEVEGTSDTVQLKEATFCTRAIATSPISSPRRSPVTPHELQRVEGIETRGRLPALVGRVPVPVFQILPPAPPHLRRHRWLRLCRRAVDGALGADFFIFEGLVSASRPDDVKSACPPAPAATRRRASSRTSPTVAMKSRLGVQPSRACESSSHRRLPLADRRGARAARIELNGDLYGAERKQPGEDCRNRPGAARRNIENVARDAGFRWLSRTASA